MVLNEVLTRWSTNASKPLVLLIDEIDSLIGDTLIAVLRQLRAGYSKRPDFFPQSIVLCGVRDVRDYRIHSARDKAIITGGSAFNIKAESLRLGNFEPAEVERLLQQHTTETGQEFEPAAKMMVWELTRGQPWLVNALAYEVCFKMEMGLDRAQPITADMITRAKERLVLRRETHLDQLVDKLKEPRVQRVISPMLQGTDLERTVSQDDIQYVIDLGLVQRTPLGLQIANPIYREVIPRELGYITQLNFESTYQPAWYIAAGGRLEMDRLLAAFQQFFREHSESWVERFDYKEAGPQLLMQVFLQRIINGGGRVERECGLGRGRTDLLVIWPYPGGEQRVVIELKLLYRSLAETIADGLKQTWAYMDRSGAKAGHLVVFDRTREPSWEEKLFVREERSVPNEEYSARFQLRLLALDPGRLAEPVLDLGCGASGGLVNFLRDQGKAAFGLDRLAPDGPYFYRQDWFEFDIGRGEWGTLIAHHSFSTHFIYNHLHHPAAAEQYARLYMRLLAGLKPGGMLCYTPGLPFFEDSLATTGRYALRKTTIAANSSLGIGEIFYAVQVRFLAA